MAGNFPDRFGQDQVTGTGAELGGLVAVIRFIQRLLGHEKLDTTAIYTEVSIKQLQEVHARCHSSAQAVAVEPLAVPVAQDVPVENELSEPHGSGV